MRKTVATLFIALSVLIAQSGVAHADNVPVTATLTGATVGTRTLTVPLSIALATSSGVSTINGSFQTVVTEAAKAGANPWKVTTSLSDLVLQGSPTDTISKSQVDLFNRATTPVAGGGTITHPGTDPQDFSVERTLVNNVQNTLQVYTGTYTTTAGLQLHIPNGTKTGIYDATMTITLVQ
ncbi:MAG: hypothetical protein QOF60_3254 [Actinomycetota bacterium]|jgi:hypothetical protein|nr:hypothetical protein [Actinomycetota bacterium]